MTEPIKAGDDCVVVGGALGARKQPNQGREVVVMSLRGEHSEFGRIWRCRSKDGLPFVRQDPYAHQGVPADQADFAASWLQKPDAPPAAPTTTVRDLEVA